MYSLSTFFNLFIRVHSNCYRIVIFLVKTTNFCYDEIMAVLLMMVLPVFLWLVELMLPYPVIVEEIAKAMVVRRAENWRKALGLGLVFGLSEAMLFLANANWLGSFSPIWWRLILTAPMHGIASLVFYATGKKYWWLGLAGAMIIHAVFNLKIAS